MMNVKTKSKTAAKPKVKVAAVVALRAENMVHKELLHKAFQFYHNKFTSTKEIDNYCQKQNLDRTYLGLSDGTFYETVSKKSKAFSQLQDLGILNKEGKDSYGNHLVIPVMEEMRVTSLEFVDLNKLKISDNQVAPSVPALLPLSKNSFRVDLSGRVYQIQSLSKNPYQLKVILKLAVGKFKHIDVINFYSAGNRKRLLRDICELFLFPHDDIRSDIIKLIELCENYETQGSPQLSANANQLWLFLSESPHKEFSCTDIEEALLWNHSKAFRALKELSEINLVEKASTGRPILYQMSEQLNKNAVDLQGLIKSS